MKIDVTQVLKRVGSRQAFSFATTAEILLAGAADPWLTGKISAEGEIVNNGRFLTVNGVINAVASQVCNRCLSAYSRPVAIPVAEDFKHIEDTTETDRNDEHFRFSGDELDITELVREMLLLAEPLKSLCREDCKGLCPQCGVNLNQTACSCDRDAIDPRLAALKQLLEKK